MHVLIATRAYSMGVYIRHRVYKQHKGGDNLVGPARRETIRLDLNHLMSFCLHIAIISTLLCDDGHKAANRMSTALHMAPM